MFRAIRLATVAACLAAPAMAQDTPYLHFGLSYLTNDPDIFPGIDERQHQVLLDGRGDLTFDRVLIAFRAQGRHIDTPASAFTDYDFELLVGYRVTPALTVFAGAVANGGPGDLDADPTIGVQYDFDPWALSLRYTDDPDFDVRMLELAGYYDFGNGIDVALGVTRTQTSLIDYTTVELGANYSRGPLDLSAYFINADALDSSIVGVYGSYRIADRIRLLGGLGYADTGLTEGTLARLGAGYEVTDNLWLDGWVSRQAFNDETTIGLTLTYELGERQLVTSRLGDHEADFIATGLLGGF